MSSYTTFRISLYLKCSWGPSPSPPTPSCPTPQLFPITVNLVFWRVFSILDGLLPCLGWCYCNIGILADVSNPNYPVQLLNCFISHTVWYFGGYLVFWMGFFCGSNLFLPPKANTCSVGPLQDALITLPLGQSESHTNFTSAHLCCHRESVIIYWAKYYHPLHHNLSA